MTLYRRMLEIVPHHGAALRALARLLRAQGDAQGAVEVIALDRDQREGTERAAREVELARLMVDPLRRYVDALAACERALELSAERLERHRGRRAAAAGAGDARARGPHPRARVRRDGRGQAPGGGPRGPHCDDGGARGSHGALRAPRGRPRVEARRRAVGVRRGRPRGGRVPHRAVALGPAVAAREQDGARAGVRRRHRGGRPAVGGDGAARGRRARSRRAGRDAPRREARRRRTGRARTWSGCWRGSPATSGRSSA